jgi:hypothetical protein
MKSTLANPTQEPSEDLVNIVTQVMQDQAEVFPRLLKDPTILVEIGHRPEGNYGGNRHNSVDTSYGQISHIAREILPAVRKVEYVDPVLKEGMIQCLKAVQISENSQMLYLAFID